MEIIQIAKVVAGERLSEKVCLSKDLGKVRK